jgi:chromosome segregation ATPase
MSDQSDVTLRAQIMHLEHRLQLAQDARNDHRIREVQANSRADYVQKRLEEAKARIAELEASYRELSGVSSRQGIEIMANLDRIAELEKQIEALDTELSAYKKVGAAVYIPATNNPITPEEINQKTI